MSKQINSRLKVLFVTDLYPNEKNPAAGVFVKEHAKAVSPYNDVMVIYVAGIKTSIEGFYECSDTIEDGIRVIRVHFPRSPIPKTNFLIYYWSIFRAFRYLIKNAGKPDIIHIHIYSSGLPAVLLGKFYRIPVIITEQWSTFAGYPPMSYIERQKARLVMNHSKFILPVSNVLAKDIRALGVRSQFRIIPNIVDIATFRPPSCYSKTDRTTKKILLVALLVAIKGIPYLLDALSVLYQRRKDFVLDIVGDGPNRSEYEQLTRQLNLSQIVKFHGFKTKPEVANFMQECDFLVQPSLYETFGIVPYEALATGKPVIVSDLDAFREHLTDEMALFVPPKDVTALAQAIDYMLDHYQEYKPQEMSRYVRERFSCEVIGKQLDKIYREVKR
ncbi:MAG: glycosyltransferase [Planctomycetes bacterium]|nr:glycosyltransferase [Planctomycetota bacterium]